MSDFPLARLASALDAAGLLVEKRGDLPETAGGISEDSRSIEQGDVFVAVRGTSLDGHDFLDDAAARGAGAAIVEDATRAVLPAIIVRDGRRAAALTAAAAYDYPARALTLLAVTGTNGKTTTVSALRHLLNDPAGDSRSASIGTLGTLVGSAGEAIPGGQGLTTPGPVELQRVLRALVDRGARFVAMEVSSHSLHQHRVEGLRFGAAVFTNFTRDHLDYHMSMESYFDAKARLIAQLDTGGAAVINDDDPAWKRLPAATRTVTFGSGDGDATVRARDVRYTARGSEWTLVVDGEAHDVRLPLIGDYNVTNALGAAAGAWSVGTVPRDIARALTTMPQVPGRLEVLHDQPLVIRDYAHTPNALERALLALRAFSAGRLIVLFGCGGDRDRGKRALMGRAAMEGADLVILTSDNPRTENPERILDDIEAGMSRGTDHLRVEDRRAAIERALELARAEDTVLLAGKGHEIYQIRGHERLPFDEKEIVAETISARAGPVGGAGHRGRRA
ncbi:MAG: UDP-N-acetylmuramoyl-L-alanyl-D-glutamate--2,6-diaminopimelate ligase [Gemmatimonadaceae bacterium]